MANDTLFGMTILKFERTKRWLQLGRLNNVLGLYFFVWQTIQQLLIDCKHFLSISILLDQNIIHLKFSDK
jgi:hypothetical protein